MIRGLCDVRFTLESGQPRVIRVTSSGWHRGQHGAFPCGERKRSQIAAVHECAFGTKRSEPNSATRTATRIRCFRWPKLATQINHHHCHDVSPARPLSGKATGGPVHIASEAESKLGSA